MVGAEGSEPLTFLLLFNNGAAFHVICPASRLMPIYANF